MLGNGNECPIRIKIDQKQLQDVEYFKNLSSIITNDAGFTNEIKPRISLTKAAINKNKTLFTSKLDLNLGKKPVMCYIWRIALYGAETWTFQKIDQKYLESFRCGTGKGSRRSVGQIVWKGRIILLYSTKDERNTLDTTDIRKADWIGHNMRINCIINTLLKER